MGKLVLARSGDPSRSSSPARILVSAYLAKPGKGSEHAAGYSIVRAAASLGDVWVLTHQKNAGSLEAALRKEPTEHRVTVVPLEVSGALARPRKGVPITLPYYARWQRLAGRRAVELDREIDFDVAHHATMTALWLPIGISRLDKPLVVGSLAGGCLSPSRLLRYLGPREFGKDCLRLVVTRSAGLGRRLTWRSSPPVIIAQEPETAAFLRRWVLPAGAAVDIHPNASEADVNPWPGTPDEVNDEIIFVGRLRSWKGTTLAIDAFLEAAVGGLKLVFIGDGADRERMERMVRERGAEDIVEFAGWRPRAETIRRVRSARAFLFPSFHDSSGFAAAEAMTMGVPVLCLDHGGPAALAELWPDGGHVAVHPGGPAQVVQDLAAAIREVAARPVSRPATPIPAARTFPEVLAAAYGRALAGAVPVG